MATAGEQQNATKAVFGALPMVAEPHGSPMQNHLSGAVVVSPLAVLRRSTAGFPLHPFIPVAHWISLNPIDLIDLIHLIDLVAGHSNRFPNFSQQKQKTLRPLGPWHIAALACARTFCLSLHPLGSLSLARRPLADHCLDVCNLVTISIYVYIDIDIDIDIDIYVCVICIYISAFNTNSISSDVSNDVEHFLGFSRPPSSNPSKPSPGVRLPVGKNLRIHGAHGILEAKKNCKIPGKWVFNC